MNKVIIISGSFILGIHTTFHDPFPSTMTSFVYLVFFFGNAAASFSFFKPSTWFSKKTMSNVVFEENKIVLSSPDSKCSLEVAMPSDYLKTLSSGDRDKFKKNISTNISACAGEFPPVEWPSSDKLFRDNGVLHWGTLKLVQPGDRTISMLSCNTDPVTGEKLNDGIYPSSIKQIPLQNIAKQLGVMAFRLGSKRLIGTYTSRLPIDNKTSPCDWVASVSMQVYKILFSSSWDTESQWFFSAWLYHPEYLPKGSSSIESFVKTIDFSLSDLDDIVLASLPIQKWAKQMHSRLSILAPSPPSFVLLRLKSVVLTNEDRTCEFEIPLPEHYPASADILDKLATIPACIDEIIIMPDWDIKFQWTEDKLSCFKDGVFFGSYTDSSNRVNACDNVMNTAVRVEKYVGKDHSTDIGEPFKREISVLSTAKKVATQGVISSNAPGGLLGQRISSPPIKREKDIRAPSPTSVTSTLDE